MTAIAAATWKNDSDAGAVIAGDSRHALNDANFKTHVVKEAKKVCSLQKKAAGFALASSPDLHSWRSRGSVIRTVDVGGILWQRLVNSQTPADVIDVKATLNAVANAYMTMGMSQPRIVEVLLAIGCGQPRLEYVRLDLPSMQTICKSDFTAMGMSVFEWYRYALKDVNLIPADETTVRALLAAGKHPPPFPATPFGSRSDARTWCVEVVEWCALAFPKWCSLPASVVDTTEDNFFCSAT